jgi:hypothetical protein
MHKLLHIIYGVLKSEKPFDADYLKKHEKKRLILTPHLSPERCALAFISPSSYVLLPSCEVVLLLYQWV